ncbi:uncharacterized protein LOC121874868 [Homarus americanus]|uniref:uncharacterized protein LOC121870904 n=1 Tax=Homarus americanus TaxID=6706 RepID=UPI001C470152|nr:uncharacterized protein LOC121870904 [Homarus americanus]XP_042235103.1 uncharacterized protein LOC121874868 [Homarus americanus]
MAKRTGDTLLAHEAQHAQICAGLTKIDLKSYMDSSDWFDKNDNLSTVNLYRVIEFLQFNLSSNESLCTKAQKKEFKNGTKLVEYVEEIAEPKENIPRAMSVAPVTSFKEQPQSVMGTKPKKKLFCKVCKRYAKLASQLTKLLTKDVEFTWNKEQEDSFNALKSALTKAPVLAFPEYMKPFTMLRA